MLGTKGDMAALEMARVLHPDVVVMDVSMPRLGGVEATHCMKAEFSWIKVIGLSDKGRTG
jgi:DNA-binding NarL/FixJ family response regulator